jgi:hypothetical protein
VGVHILFLIFYISLSNVLPAEFVMAGMILHCVINIASDFMAKRPLYVMTPYYVGIILVMTANILLLNKIAVEGILETNMYGYIDMSHVSEATQLLCVGYTTIFIGYEAFRKRSFPSIAIELNSRKLIRNIYLFIIVFTLLNVSGMGINLSMLGGLQRVFSLLIVVGILFYARLWSYENSTTYRNYALVLCALQTVVALYTSFLRAELIIPVVALAVGYFIGKGSVKFLFSYRIIPLAVALVIFSMFFQNLAGNRAHFIDAFDAKTTGDPNNSSYVVQDEGSSNGGFLERDANLAQVTNLVKLVKRNGFYRGQVSTPLLAAVIPRFLWPGKPDIQLGAWFALEIGAASLTENGRANNSINMTIPGELYLDFGWIGLIVGCFLFGGLVAAFWNAAHLVDSPYNLSGTLWGGYLLLFALGGIGADLQIVISLTSTYLVFLILKRIVQRNENTRLRAAVEGK